MQISHRASELLHNIFNSENILKVQAQVFVFGNNKRKLHTPYTNRLCLKWQSIYAFLNLKRKSVLFLPIEKLIKQKHN